MDFSTHYCKTILKLSQISLEYGYVTPGQSSKVGSECPDQGLQTSRLGDCRMSIYHLGQLRGERRSE